MDQLQKMQQAVDRVCRDVQGRLQSIDTKDLAQQARTFVWPIVPFASQALVSAGAFTGGLSITQLSGFALRVSCNTPVLSSALGVTGVGLASAMASLASQHCRNAFEPSRRQRAVAPSGQDLLRDVLVGVIAFKMMGGRFRSLLPSDLRYVGACARESVPIPIRSKVEVLSPQYSDVVQKRELRRMYKRDGCHHCGKRSGAVIGDHQPPVKMAAAKFVPNLAERLEWAANNNMFARMMAEMAGGRKAVRRLSSGTPKGEATLVRQRFYPQCTSCSGRQSQAVKHDRQCLVMHRGASDWWFVGALVGLQYVYDMRRAYY